MSGLVLAAALLGAAPLQIQPGAAHPGDAVLITVRGADTTPSGKLGGEALDFVPFHDGYQALLGLSVEAKAGPLEVAVTLESDGKAQQVSGSLDVLPADFPHRELTVSTRFTSPSKKEKAWGAADQKAFAKAFDVELEPFLFAGGFRWPRPPDFTAPFGDLRLINGKKSSQHFGADLDGDTGDPIYAANDGEVVMVRECFASGNTVLIHHGAKLFTAYFHLSAFAVREGDVVHAGDLLGKVGKTGRVTGPHLHWGAKLGGRWVNPVSLMALEWD